MLHFRKKVNKEIHKLIIILYLFWTQLWKQKQKKSMVAKWKRMDSKKIDIFNSKKFYNGITNNREYNAIKTTMIKKHNSSVLLSNWMGFIRTATGAERFLIFHLREVRLSQSQQRDKLLVRDEAVTQQNWILQYLFSSSYLLPKEENLIFFFFLIIFWKDPKSRNDSLCPGGLLDCNMQRVNCTMVHAGKRV